MTTSPKVRKLQNAQYSEKLASSGMSLVEVTLALGITAFAAVTIMGLLTVALGHNADSTEKALVVNIFHNVSESIKTTAENSDPTQTWTLELVYDREALPTASSDASAHYRADVSAQPSATWPGSTSTNAWNIHIAIKNLPQDKVVYERNTIFVKEPPGSATN